MCEKVEFLRLFLPKEEVSIFLAIQDMRHTKLDLHVKFRHKKLAARGTYALKSGIFVPFFCPKRKYSNFLAIRDMRHTKLGLHAKFRRKKLAARGTYARKCRFFAPFFAQRGSIRISSNMGPAPYKVRPSCQISSLKS